MASVLDLGLLQYFGVIFPVLLVFVLVYAALSKFKLLGESPTINATVAISCAFLTAMSDVIISLIIFISPWMVLLFIVVLLFLFVIKTFGISDSQISDVVSKDQSVTWVIIAFTIIILLAGFAFTFGEDLISQSQDIVDSDGTISAEPDVQTAIFEVLFNPKILGVGILFLISVMAIALLTGKM